MLNEFKDWLLVQKYKPTTAEDYQGRIERLCRKEKFTLEHLIKNLSEIMPQYEKTGKKSEFDSRVCFSELKAVNGCACHCECDVEAIAAE